MKRVLTLVEVKGLLPFNSSCVGVIVHVKDAFGYITKHVLITYCVPAELLKFDDIESAQKLVTKSAFDVYQRQNQGGIL